MVKVLMWPRYGVKVGNSTLCTSIKKDNESPVDVIVNKEGDRVSPACVYWNEIKELEKGLAAKQKMIYNPRSTVMHGLQLLRPKKELNMDFVKKCCNDIPCEYDFKKNSFILNEIVNADHNGKGAIPKGSLNSITVFDVHVELLRSEFELAQFYYELDPAKGLPSPPSLQLLKKNIGKEDEQAQQQDEEEMKKGKEALNSPRTLDRPAVVISIPDYYSNGSRKLLSEAAHTAGFHVSQIIPETTAAMLGYKLAEQLNEKDLVERNILCIKMGGLYSYATLNSIQQGFYMQKCVTKPFALGGIHITEILVEYIAEQFISRHKINPHKDKRAMYKIHSAANECKHALSDVETVCTYIESLINDIDFSCEISRSRFEELLHKFLVKFYKNLDDSIEFLLHPFPDIKQFDDVILLGGSMYIPKLQEFISSRFPNSTIHKSINCDEVAAIGNGNQAGYIPNIESSVIEPVEVCILKNELRLWHADNEKNSKVLLMPGCIVPISVVLKVPVSTTDPESRLFHISMDGDIIEAHLTKGQPSNKGYFKIKAEIYSVNEIARIRLGLLTEKD